MKYLLLTIFATNIFFYSFLLLKPNGDSFYFLIAQDNSLSDVFEILERKNFFPKIIKSIFVVTGTDKKIYQGNYQINKDDSVYEIFKKIYFGKIVLKKIYCFRRITN